MNRDFEVRGLRPSDVPAAAGLLIASYPHRAHEPRSWDRTARDEQRSQWGAFLPDGTLAAYAALWMVSPRRFRFDVVVEPLYRRRGLGTRLFETVLLDAHQRGAARLQARAYGTSTEAVALLSRLGFVETMRMRGFVLDLVRSDSSAFRPSPAAGIPDVSIARISDAATSDATLWRGLADLHRAALEGWPDPDPDPTEPIDPVGPDDVHALLSPPESPPLAFFVARESDSYVGYSVLARRNQSPGEAQFRATAVRPEYRNRGIAKALRARCLLLAKQTGHHTVRSASGNPALIHLNTTTGFQEIYSEIRLVLRLAR